MQPWWIRNCCGVQPCWMLVVFFLLILLLGLLPLLSGVVKAEASTPCLMEFVSGPPQWVECAEIIEPKNPWDPQELQMCDEGHCRPIVACMDKMEAAMRAMDPYLEGYKSWQNVTTLEYCGEECWVRKQLADLEAKEAWWKRRNEAKAKWENVKQECWRKP